jgi:hypothetical protein
MEGDTIWFDHSVLSDPISVSADPLMIDKNLVLYNPADHPVTIELSHMLSVPDSTIVEFHRVELIAGANLDSTMISNAGAIHFFDSTLTGSEAADTLLENTGQVFIDGTCILARD